MNTSYWHGRRVLVTGHTGFMGGWLCERLIGLGATVSGFALAPPTEPSLFSCLGLAGRMDSTIGDIRDLEGLTDALKESGADTVFHLAAQALVRRAHREPVETFTTNVMGTVNMLEAIRRGGHVDAAVIVTTDKVYDNREWAWGYRENDALGGCEPYGVSKACADLATEAYVCSFFDSKTPAVATVRAGNIIGGGDWAEDRLVPDAIRAFTAGEILRIRHPGAIRPWQHVLEPVEGLLMLAEGLTSRPGHYRGCWNLGPPEDDVRTVSWVADRLVRAWGGTAAWTAVPDAGPHEAHMLTLSSSKARASLGWSCRWRTATTVERTAAWYRAHSEGADMVSLTRKQINDYVKGEDRGEFERQDSEKRNRAVA